MSGFLWVLILIIMGFVFGKMLVFLKYEDEVMFFLMLLFLVLLVIGLFGFLYVFWCKKNIMFVNDSNDKGKLE